MQKVIDYYRDIFGKYGANDERSLGWSKNKQYVRFAQLFRFLFSSVEENFKKSLLDIGCGFGDMYAFLKKSELQDNIDYYGIDMMQEFIDVAVSNHPDKKDDFRCLEFLSMDESVKYDYCVASGIFGHKIFDTEDEIYEQVEKTMQKALNVCNIGVSFDFLSDKVDYRTSTEDFHASPAKILEIAYKFSRRVILDNSAMPFEFCITVFKDDSFSKENTIFTKYSEKC